MAKPADEARIVINFRIRPSLKPRLEAAAERDRRSVSSWLELAVEQAIEAAEAAEKPKRRV